MAEETRSDEEALTKNEGEFLDVLHFVIAEAMNVTFKEVLLENMVMKEQIASLNTQVQGLEATVSNLNSMVLLMEKKYQRNMQWKTRIMLYSICI